MCVEKHVFQQITVKVFQYMSMRSTRKHVSQQYTRKPILIIHMFLKILYVLSF